MRMHLIGVSLIVLVGAAALMTSVKVGTPPPAAANGEGVINVSGATWGYNCFGKPKQPLQQPQPQPAETEGGAPAEQTPVTPPEPKVEVKTDNVLQAMAGACNGKTDCEVPVEAKSFGGELDAICSPEFRAEYRCYHFGRLLSVDVHGGSKAKLSCAEESETTKSTTP